MRRPGDQFNLVPRVAASSFDYRRRVGVFRCRSMRFRLVKALPGTIDRARARLSS
jgi:hypothetical protein